MYNRNTKSFHPKSGSRSEQHIEEGSSLLGNFFCLIFATLIILWLCQDTSAGLTVSLHHSIRYENSSTGFWPLDILIEWL